VKVEIDMQVTKLLDRKTLKKKMIKNKESFESISFGHSIILFLTAVGERTLI